MSGDGVRKWTIRMPDNLATAADVLADMRGVSINQLVVDLIATEVAGAKTDPETVARVKREIEALREQYGL